jgi:gliding motility-associated-like protein
MKHALPSITSILFVILAAISIETSNAQCPVVIDSVITADVTCNGAMDGTITIYTSGGFPDYNYQISNGPFFQNGVSSNNTFTFSGLGAGFTDYLVLVISEDGSGGTCPSPPSAFVTISDPPPFNIVVTATDEVCPDSNDGTATVVASGGQAPYSYQWPPFPVTDSLITGLDSGLYTVIVTDFNGCSQTEPYTIFGPADWADTLIGTDVTCFGANDGTITASGVTGGTAPYNFSWSPGGMTTENLSGLGPNTYTLTITDANLCTFSPPAITIAEPTEIILTETHVDVVCDGTPNGSIDLTITGGVPPYSINWSNGETTEDLSGLAGGTYLVTVTDTTGCIATTPVTIQDGAQLSLLTTVVNSECNAQSGIIDLTVVGGSGDYAYSWLPGGEATEDIASLGAGVYIVTVTDNVLGCIDSSAVIVTDFPGPDISGIVTNGSNCVESDGTIDITVTGGSGAYTFQWTHGPTTEDVTGLSEGVYLVTVTDNTSGCIGISSFTVLADADLDITASITDASCGLLDGAINLAVSGPNGPYTFLWSTAETTEDLSGLGAGLYLVTVSDANGCTRDTSFVVMDLGSPTLSSTLIDPSCDGFLSGSIDITAAGGTLPYDFSWSNGATTEDLNGLGDGDYTLTVTDGSGCQVIEIYTLLSPPVIYGSVDITNASCNGLSDGSIEAFIFGGTPPYDITWTPGPVFGSIISGVPAGPYLGSVIDQNGCSISGLFTINEPPSIQISESHNDITCNGEDNGSIDIAVSGGEAPYTYLWTPGGMTTDDLTGLSPGTYTVSVADATGCTKTLDIVIDEPAVLALNPSSTNATCNGICDGVATVAPTGGTSAYTYVWTPNVSTSPSATGLCGGTYSVIVTDANGCQDSTEFIIQDSQILATVASTDVVCGGTCDGTISISTTGPNPPFTYVWTPSVSADSTANNLCAGSYTVSITDGTGCSIQEIIVIDEAQPITISMAITDVTCEGGADGAIDLSVLGGTPPYTYTWFPSGQTTQDLTNIPAGNYSVLVTDANGCNSSSIVLGGSFNGETLALPDGTGTSYSTDIIINGFNPGETLTDINDFTGICIDMEHTWLFDLDIVLSCPSGQSVALVQTTGVGTEFFLGDANDNDDITPAPGTGFEYCWDNSPAFGTMADEANGGNTIPVSQGNALPPGSYTSEEPLTNLIGCDLNGNWTIAITDNFASDNGFVFDWNIGFTSATSNDSSAVVNEPVPIDLTSTSLDATCGQCDGSATVTPSGGIAPYTFLWSNGETSPTISDRCAGVYEIEVTDANGCFSTFYIPISNTDGPSEATTNTTDATCFGLCDGTADITPIGGTAPYNYQWVPGGYTSNNVTGLCAGAYFVQIQDSLGCIFTETVVIAEPAQILVGQAVTNSTCGNCDGEIHLTPLVGTPPYSYDWSPVVSTVDTAANLCAGVYGITITDGTGCSESITVLLDDFPAPTVTATGTDLLCNADCDGEAVANVGGGNPPYSYQWDDLSSQTTPTASALCSGLYTVTVTDNLGCIATAQTTLFDPDPVDLSILIVNNGNCNGACDGEVTVVPSGGSLPFTYQWNDPGNQTTETATDLCGGTFTVVVTDANGCQDSASVTLINSVITNVVTATDILCEGECNGTISIATTGPSEPFTYDWVPNVSSSSDASSLCAGTYTITVTDQLGCSVIETAVIDEPLPIELSMVITDVSCEGASDGAIDLTVAGGTAPYTYTWFPSGQTTQDLNNIPAGTYSVVVTDANGCSSSSIELGGAFNGGTLELPDGTGTSYSTNININGFNPGETFTDINDFAGICINMEHTWLFDLDIVLSCPSGQSVFLVQSGGVGDEFFLGDANDNDDITPLPGTGFEYCWDNSPTFGTMADEANGGNTIPVSQGNALPPGSYTSDGPLTDLLGCDLNGDWTITITDNFAQDNGFVFDWSIAFNSGTTSDSLVIVNEPGPITLTSTTVDASCGICNGEATVTPNGGTAPYTYLWNNGETTATINNQCAGVYEVEVTDASGCFSTFYVPISNDEGPTDAITNSTDATCFGSCDGTADVTPIGGTAPYVFQWVPGSYTTSSVTGLCAGVYYVQIQDSLGCIYTDTVIIDEPAQIQIGQAVTNSSCGACDGEINLTPLSGAPPYSYTWVPPVSTTDTAANLCAGVYGVTVMDGTGCTETVTILMNDFPAAGVTGFGSDPLCDTDCNGEAWVSAIGGNPPFSYQWDDSSTQTTDTAVALCEGLYTITVTDSLGCIATAQVTLEDPDPISLSLLIVNNSSCFGICDGSLTVIPSGGTLPFTYQWNDPGSQTTETASGLCAGTYEVIVTDANGCTETITGTVEDPTGLSATIDFQDATCNGDCDGLAWVTVSGGTPPYAYMWNDPLAQATDTAFALCAGLVDVVITDDNGCEFFLSTLVGQPDSITIAITGIVNLQCDGDCIGEALATASGGTGPYTYQWDDPLLQTTPAVDSLCASTYTVTVTDTNGCVADEQVVITGPGGLSSNIVSQVNASCNGDCDGEATVEGIGGTPPYTYQWNDPLNQTTPTADSLCTGTYGVSVTDANGCVSVSTVVIAQPDILGVTTTADDVSCFGECDGSATAFTTGGTFPYFYQWNDPLNQTTLTANNLCPGNYEVVVTDVNGCVAIVPVTLFEPTEITIDTTIIPAACGFCDGSITVAGVGGVPPFSYLWGNGETTSTITGLCPGVYTVDITDGIGCTENFDIAVSNVGGATSAIVTVINTSCFGICDGEGSIEPEGGTAPYTYLWVPGGQNTQTATGLCAGDYNVQVVDSFGCIYTQLVTIGEPLEIESNYNAFSASCGNCDGVITLAPTGGDGGPYTFDWSPVVSATDSASGLCPGTYTVIVTDGSGCSTTEVIPINNIDGPVVTTASTDVSCNGDCDGTATLTITDGTPPYTILWDDPLGQTAETATGLCAGTYSGTVTDANGCVTVGIVTIDEPNPISLSLQLVDNVTCPGACDGSATIIASGGTLPYTFNWTPSGGTNPTATDLCAGSYIVEVTDANGCAENVTVEISEPPTIVINTSSQDASCAGICDGEAYVETSGATPPFSYFWPIPGSVNDTVTGLCADTYMVFVTDANGCLDSASVTVTEPDSISITTTSTGVSCSGDCDGIATAFASGGTPPFTYQWNDPLNQNTPEADSLCPGIYSVLVTDSLGCFNTASVVIDEPLPIALIDSVSNVSCGGECDGVVGVLPLGGTPPFAYQWNDPDSSITPFITGLCAGDYSVLVTDDNGCTDSLTLTVTEPPELFAPVTQVDPTCGGVCDGSLTVTPSGGTPPYSILWLPNSEETPTIDSICAGEYILQLIDANGCSVTDTFTLIEPPILTAAITDVTQVLCENGCTGSATVTSVGGTPPYIYAWTPNVGAGPAVNNLCVGTYDVVVTDSIGCTATTQIVINDDNALIGSIALSTPATCNGDCDGTASASAVGGLAPYFYAWNDPFNQTTETATSLCAGTYTVIIFDSQVPACTTQATVTIDEPPVFSTTTTGTDITCGGECDGAAAAMPTGGTEPYTYLWNDPASQTTPTAANLCVGTYAVTVTDANECIATASVTISGPLAINSNATSTSSSCSNISDGGIDLSVVGGLTPYSYSWTPGSFNTQDLINMTSGSYSVTVTDADGCTHTAIYEIGTLVTIEAELASPDTVCSGEEFQLLGEGGDFYSWEPISLVDDPNAQDVNIVLDDDTVTFILTTSIGTCFAIDSASVVALPPPAVDAGNDEQILPGGSINFNANGAATGWEYTWEPTEFLDDPNISNPFASPDETTMFYVAVTDEFGCTNSDSILVEVLPDIKFPDGITPNGDYVNDVWFIDNINNYRDVMVEVYNRWGQQMFVSEPGYPQPWDGKYKGKDLPVGTYYYVIHSVDLEEALTGPITIVR